jgi:uncharacterized protein (TIGR00730 family)
MQVAPIKSVCVFCGAKEGADPKYMATAFRTGEMIAELGLKLVYGGGGGGLMGAVASGAMRAGGEVHGIIPTKLIERELAKKDITSMEEVPDMAVRKTKMIAQSDAFISLPGGLGTLDEMFEVMTLRQLGYHSKPVGLLNQDGYYDNLVAMCEGFLRDGFVRDTEYRYLIVERSPEALLKRLVQN